MRIPYVVLHVRNQTVELNKFCLKLRYQPLTKETAQEELAVGVGELLDSVVELSNF